MKQPLEGIQVLLLDIEGTICPISFVKDTLFPYALNALPQILSTKWNAPDFQPYKSAFPDQAQSSPEAFLAHVQDLTARDVKIAYLKNLQGYLWESGYKTRAYSTPLFPDVVPALNTFISTDEQERRQVAIYSSGSVFAQKLLFAHVRDPATTTATAGAGTATGDDVQDMTGLITAWFDTTNAGPKTDRRSYERIVGELNIEMGTSSGTATTTEGDGEKDKESIDPARILFLSDNVNEVRAALEAGVKAVVVDRPGNAPLTPEDQEKYRVIESLDELGLRHC